jgi:hypothetical protein
MSGIVRSKAYILICPYLDQMDGRCQDKTILILAVYNNLLEQRFCISETKYILIPLSTCMLGSLYSFCAISAELKCGVHPHQVLVTSSSKCGLCHDKKSEQVRGNAPTQPCGLCNDKNQSKLEAKHPLFS